MDTIKDTATTTTETRECIVCRGTGTITLTVVYEYSTGLLTTEIADCTGCAGTGSRAVYVYPRSPKFCAGCGEEAGSRSAGTGAPLVGKRGGPFYHANCQPGVTPRTFGEMI